MRTGALLLAVVALAVAGCRPPKPLQGEFAPVTVLDAQMRDATGEHVRWGGVIVKTTPEESQTCFEVVSRPLDRRAEPPIRSDVTYGRFIACADGFYDPAVWEEKRRITVVGTVDGFVDGTIGDRPYRYPRVRAEAVWLWPRPRPQPDVVYADPWGPWWGPGWGPWWGPYPYWGGGVWVGRRRR